MLRNEIWHGDSRTLAADLPDGINCFVVDPPYGVDFVSRKATTPGGKKFTTAIEGDGDLAGAIQLFDEVMDAVLPKAATMCELYVFTRWDIVDEWVKTIRRLDRHQFKYKMMLLWDKGIPGLGDIDANWGCGYEVILYLKKGRRDIHHRRSGIIHVDKLGSAQHIHPTEKPVGLIEKLLEMSTDPGDWVVDPFSGSGSTATAAMRLGRNAIGIEKDERYIEDSRRRLTQLQLI